VHTRQEEVARFFQKWGEVRRVHIQQKNNSSSAQVTFADPAAAERALTESPRSIINGREIRVVWNRDPPARPHDSTFGFSITNIPQGLSERKALELLKERGPVANCRLYRSGTPTLRIFCESAADVDSIYANLQATPLFTGQRLIKGLGKGQQKPEPEPEERIPLPEFILHFESSTRDQTQPDSLKKLLAPFGEIDGFLPLPNSSVLAILESSTAATRAVSSIRVSGLSISRGIRPDWAPSLRKLLEARTVVVSNVLSAEHLRPHLETVGVVDTVEEISPTTFSVCFTKLSARQAAIETLHRSLFEGQSQPISVLPFVDVHLAHEWGGLLQLNEVPPTWTVAKLRGEFARFGRLYGATICPAQIPNSLPYGYVFFETYDGASRARRETPGNLFLYPPIGDLLDAMRLFNEGPPISLVLTDVDVTKVEATVRKFNPTSFAVAEKCACAFFSRAQFVMEAASALRSEGVLAEVLGAQGHGASELLQRLPLLVDWQGRLLFFGRLDPDLNALGLRGRLENAGLPVEAAFVLLSKVNGLGTGSGVALLKERPGFMPRDGQWYRSAPGYSAVVPVATAGKYEWPGQNLAKRDWMKMFVTLNFGELQAAIDPVIEQLSVDEVWQVLAAPEIFVRWIESVVQKAKQMP
jgi:hypothetical protein